MITHDGQQGAIKYYTTNVLVDYGTGANCSMFAISTITGKIYKARVATVSDRTKDPSANSLEWIAYGEGAGSAGPVQASKEYTTTAEGYAAVSIDVAGVLTEMYLPSGAFTTDATPTIQKLVTGGWKYRDQIAIPNVAASTYYPAGFLVSDGQRPAAIYAAIAAITSNATTFVTELEDTAKWTLKGGGGSMGNIRAWAAATRVEPDELRRQTIGGTMYVLRHSQAAARTTEAAGSWSGATQTEPANWVCLAQEGIADFVAGEWYVPGCRVSKGGSEWIRTAAPASEATWDSTKWKLVDVPFLLREEITGNKTLENYTEYIGNSAADTALELPSAATAQAAHRIEFINNNGKKYTFTMKVNTDKLNGTVNGTVASTKVGERLIFTMTKDGEWRWTGSLTFNITRDANVAVTGGTGVAVGEARTIHLPLTTAKRLGVITTTPANVPVAILSRRDILQDVAIVQVTMPQADVNLVYTQVDDTQVFNPNWDVGVVQAIASSAPQTDAHLPMSGGTYSRAGFPDLYDLVAGGKFKLATHNATDQTFTLFNLNSGAAGGAGYFLGGLAGNPVGTLQDDATAPNGLRVTARGHVWDQTCQSSDRMSEGTGGGTSPHDVITGDAETRPYTARILWVVKARPTPVHVEAGGTYTLQTTDVKLRSVSATAPAGNLVNGLASIKIGEGYGGMVLVPLTTDKMIDTVTATSGTATVIDAVYGVIWVVPAAADVALTVTEKAHKIKVTCTGANNTINGTANFSAVVGKPNDFIIDMPTNKRLDSVGSSTGTISIINPLAGYVRLLNPTADTVITPTLGDAASYNGLQKVRHSTTQLALTATLQNYNVGATLVEGDLLEIEHQYNAGATERQSCIIHVSAGTTQRYAFWPDATNNMHYFAFPAVLNDTFQVRQATANSAPRIISVKVWRDAANGWVVPTGTQIRDAVPVTANSGALTVNGVASSLLFSGTSGRVMVPVPSNQMITGLAATNATASIADPYTGAIEVAVALGSTAAVELTVTFEDIPLGYQRFAPAAGSSNIGLGATTFSYNFTANRTGLWDIETNVIAWDGSATPDPATLVEILQGATVLDSFQLGGFASNHITNNWTHVGVAYNRATLINGTQYTVRVTSNGSSAWDGVGIQSIALKMVTAGNSVVPVGTQVRDEVTVTANSGAVQVNGAATATLFAGTSGRISVAVPAGQILTAVTAPAGLTASIADSRTGAIEVAVDTGISGAKNLSLTFATPGASRVLAQANAGVAVTLGTLRFRMPTGGNRSLQVASATGAPINTRVQNLHMNGGSGAGLRTHSLDAAGTFLYIDANWNFGGAGDWMEVVVEDTTNNRWYRMRMEIGSGYNNNTFAGYEIL